MKRYEIKLTVLLPEDYDEHEIDVAIADAICDNDGEILDISEYKQLKELGDE